MPGSRALTGASGVALLLVALLGGPALAELRVVQAVGAVAVGPGGDGSQRPPRDAALDRALEEAVLQVARSMAGQLEPGDADAQLVRALGDPRGYASRYRILEDRGLGPALFVTTPGVEQEYALLVEVQVDADRIRDLLERAAVISPAGTQERRVVRLVIRDLDGYAAYRAVRTVLEELGVDRATPVEMERGTAVLEVESDLGPTRLLQALQRAAPPELRIQALAADGESLTLRAQFLPPLGGPEDPEG